MPYGQALVDGMAAFEASFVGQPALMAERTEALRALVVGETGGYLERLFEDNSLDALVRINNSGASAGAFANFPALTMPVGYRDSGQPIGIEYIRFGHLSRFTTKRQSEQTGFTLPLVYAGLLAYGLVALITT